MKWEKLDKKGAGYEASTCFMAREVSEKYQSQICQPLEHLAISVARRSEWQMFLHR
jgi:hypothetical protein